MTQDAPFRNDLAEGPDEFTSRWITTEDNVRLRAVHWPATAARGTIFIFTGRAEYAEKYGRVAQELVKAGWSILTIDWRGQGFSDRQIADGRLGHVEKFTDYQFDVRSMVTLAAELDLPRPWNMLAHSMGGCIGLRSLTNGLDVTRTVFSAPMWGIRLEWHLRSAARVVPKIAHLLGQGHRVAPGMTPETYVLHDSFDDNMLTTDREHFDWLVSHVQAEPLFAIGGPTLDWLGAAMSETATLARLPRPVVDTLTCVGTDERVVDMGAIVRSMQGWYPGQLLMVDGAQHELMMEAPDMRREFMTAMLAHFDNPEVAED